MKIVLEMASGDNYNAIWLHMAEEGHRMDVKNAYLLKKCNSYVERNIIESCLIDLTWNKNVNISKGLYNIDAIGCYLINKQLKLI